MIQGRFDSAPTRNAEHPAGQMGVVLQVMRDMAEPGRLGVAAISRSPEGPDARFRTDLDAPAERLLQA